MSVSQQPPVTGPARFPYSALLRTTALCACVALLAPSGGCGRKKPAPERAEPLPLQSFARQWATDLQLKGDTLKGLHVREGNIFAYTRNGRVAALGRDAGSIEYWVTVKGGKLALHPPVVMANHLEFRRQISAPKYGDEARWEVVGATPVVFPTATTLEIYDHKSKGQYVTSVDLKSGIRSDVIGANGTVYFGGAYPGGSRGAAVDITQPYVAVKWQVMFPKGGIPATPAMSGDTVFFAGEDGSVIAVAASDRRALWPLANGAFQTGAAVVADLSADDQAVYVASTDTKLYALNRNNGRIRWQYFGGAALRQGPAVTSDTVYQFVPSIGVAALDKGTGSFDRAPKWVAEDCTQFLAQDERNAYLRRRDGTIVARDKKSGQVRFASRRRDFNVFATNVLKDDGMIYAATKQGRIMAIRPILKPGVVGEIVRLEELTPGEAVAVASDE